MMGAILDLLAPKAIGFHWHLMPIYIIHWMGLNFTLGILEGSLDLYKIYLALKAIRLLSLLICGVRFLKLNWLQLRRRRIYTGSRANMFSSLAGPVRMRSCTTGRANKKIPLAQHTEKRNLNKLSEKYENDI